MIVAKFVRTSGRRDTDELFVKKLQLNKEYKLMSLAILSNGELRVRLFGFGETTFSTSHFEFFKDGKKINILEELYFPVRKKETLPCEIFVPNDNI